MIVTTSWDDGHPLNLKLSDLLNKYNLKGTFYIHGSYLKSQKGRGEVLKIAKTQEIGAHTFSHCKLSQVSISRAKTEIEKGKTVLEDLLGRPVEMFAYPYGFFNDEIKKAVQEAGFLGACTTKECQCEKPKDFFEFGMSLHVYPHPFRKKDSSHLHGPKVVFQPLQKNSKTILRLGLPLKSFLGWPSFAENLFDYVYKNNKSIFRLFGHSHEIERYGMWDELEKFFQFIGNHDKIEYLTNSQALKHFNG